MVVKKVVKKPAKNVAKKVVQKKYKIIKQKYACENCDNEVFELDHAILITTTNKGRITQEVVFHIDCWKEYFEKAVLKKSKQRVASVQKKVMGLMENPIVKSMLSNVDGIGNIMSMLQTPLSEDAVDKVKEKIEYGKKRTSKA